MFGEAFQEQVPIVKPTLNNGMNIESLFLKGIAKHFTFIFYFSYVYILRFQYNIIIFSNKIITIIKYYGENIDGYVYS